MYSVIEAHAFCVKKSLQELFYPQPFLRLSMGGISKSFSLILIVLLAASSLIMAKPACAQSIPIPSVPQFTVQIVSNPYLIPQTNVTDPYTGQVTIYPSQIDENKSIVVTVKNQQFTSTQLSDGNWTQLYYNLRWEPHFVQNDWTYYPVMPPANIPASEYISASQSDYTVIPIPTMWLPATYSNGTQIDFQVQALIGYEEPIYASGSIVAGSAGYLFTGQSSDWSPSQTLVFGEPLTTNPTATPAVPEFPTWIILPLFALAILLSTVFIRKRIPKKNITFFV